MDDNKSVLCTRLLGKVESSMSDDKNIKGLLQAITKYADRHADVLLTSDMSQRLIFSDSDKKCVFQFTGMDEIEVKDAISSAPDIDAKWKKATNPFYMLSLVIMHYFFNMSEKSKNKKEKDLYSSYGDAVTVYMGYLLYTSNHKSSFPYLPNKEIMDYTINNLNNRYLLKQEGTIQSVIEHTVINAIHGRFMEEILRGTDSDFSIIISSLEARISSFIKNIADEYYNNHKDGKRIFHEEDSEDEEDFHLTDSKSYKIDRLVQYTTSQIISKGFDQNTVIKKSVQLNNGVSEKKLDAMLRTIVEDDMKSIPDMITSILTLFMYSGSANTIDDVKTIKFISESLQIYKSNAQDNLTYHVKDILLRWINMTANKYGRNFISRGKTSLDTYRRAIFTAFIFEIHECAK